MSRIPSDIEPSILLRSIGEGGELLGAGFLRKTPGVDHRDYRPGFYSLILVLQGKGRLEIDGQSHDLEAGSIFQRFPSTPHQSTILPGDTWEECFVDLGPALFKALEQMGLAGVHRPVGRLPEPEARVHAFADLFRRFQEVPRHEASSLLPHCLALAERCLREIQTLHEPHHHSVQEACRLLAASPSQRIDLKSLCRDRNWNYETFRKSFKRITGLSPQRYAMAHRMDEARKWLLSSPELSVTELAHRLGYNDVFEFSQHFKRFVGVAPSLYRGKP